MTFVEKTISSEIVYEGPIFKINKLQVEAKNGPAVRDVLVHGGGATIIAVKDDGKVLLIRQFRKAVEQELYELPAGKIDPGEEPIETARREIKEETGYTADSIEYIFKMIPSCGYSGEYLYYFLCKGLTPGETEFDKDEDIETYEYTTEELMNMIMRGEIIDGKTIAGIMYAKEAGLI